jgi:hypothetical protein
MHRAAPKRSTGETSSTVVISSEDLARSHVGPCER